MQDHHRRHADFHHAHFEARRAAHQAVQPQEEHDPNIYPLAVPKASPIFVPGPSKILGRDADSDWSATTTCTSESDPGCQLPSSSHPVQIGTIVGLSVALPILAVIVFLFYLHRRIKKKQVAEDKNYADKDLDWGMTPSKDKDGKVDYSKVGHKALGGGMSVDLGNPYMLPPDISGSRDSLHSLSRTVTDQHDPYRMVKTPSVRSDSFANKSESTRDLLMNGQPMSNSRSPLSREPIPRKAVANPFASPDSESANGGFDFGGAQPIHPAEPDEKSINVNAANRMSNPDKSLPATPANAVSPPLGGDSKSPYSPNNNAGPVDPYSFQEVVVPPSPEGKHADLVHEKDANPAINIENFPYPPPPEPEESKRQTLGLGLEMPGNRLSVLRPLPPDDPEENPEQRANRIRSFYKEYFSEGDAHGYNAGADYYEDYGDEYLQDGAIFDPTTGQFIVAQAPYAAPVTRRAMTPPPRGPPPKFRGGPRRPGHTSSGSSPGIGGPRGRAHSNASTSRVGMGPGARGRAPKRVLPPPSALKNLPTPSLLKEESFNMTMDFAPPSSFADRAAGRPESPRMDERPWEQKRIASPLVSTYSELSVMPSPHMLRKSGAFTGLDFAPPPKFKDPESMSDAGSVRSGKSGVSAMQQHSIRAGAYRLSRLPKEAVGSKSDIMNDLKPKWGLGY